MPELTATSTTETPEQVAAALGVTLQRDEGTTVASTERAPEGGSSQPVTETKPAEQPAAPVKPTEPPPEDPVQARIDRITFERYRAAEQARIEKERADALQAEIEKLKAQPQPVVKPEFVEPKPKVEDFSTLEEWADAVVDWSGRKTKFETVAETQETVKKAVDERVSADRQQTAEQEILVRHVGRIEEFKKTHADFDAVAQKALADQVPLTQIMITHVMHSELGPALLYHLAKNPAEAQRIATMNQGPALVALGRLEAKLEGGNTSPQPTVEQPSGGTTIAASVGEKRTLTLVPPVNNPPPAPITPLGGGSAAVTKDPEKMSLSEYQAWRRAGGGK